ncbi:hypothetical protein NDU88_005122 [Pleurodeles waltl]|uniref:Uncharacterized protein n=1 Tax=Pleurodeles waltl TaxID=8319 RepID=A0AAV7MFZ0_PLEWA|nr:hypothetical protein NDU88_005122 [Pleurodeles waltl]
MALSIPSNLRPTADISCSIRSIDAPCVSSVMLVCGGLGGLLQGSVSVGTGLRRKVVDGLVYPMLCPSPLWRGAPRGRRCKARLGGDAVGAGGGARQHPPPSGSKERGERRRVSGAGPPLCSGSRICAPSSAPPKPRGERSPIAGGRQARCRPLDASSGGFRGSEGRGRRASYRRTPGGASLRRGPVRHSRPRLVFLPQASGPCSALPTVRKGRALLLLTGRRPPSASDPSHMLQRCPGGSGAPAARRLAELSS